MMAMVCLPILICAGALLVRKVEAWPGLTYFPLFYTTLWLGPLLYLHGFTLMQGGALGWRKYLLLPGIIQTLYYLWAFFGLGDYRAKWDYNGAFHDPYVIPVESALAILFLIAAFIATWRLIRRYRKHLEATSSAALDYDPIWLRNIIIGIGLGGGLYAALELTDIIYPLSYIAAFPFQVLIMAVLAWFAIDATWRLLKAFPKLSAKGAEIKSENSDGKDWVIEANKLKSRVTSEKWFLESRLSIRDVAARMGTNETYLSRALNRGQKQSFNRFINVLRIEHAKQLIKSSNESFLGIALDSGFNSKATFNRVFKDIVGQTPSAYKKSQNP